MGTVHAKSMTEPEEGVLSVDGMKARVDKIHVDGLARTKDDFVISTVRELFSAQDFQQVLLKASEARERLERLGCFRNVGIFIDVARGPEATPNGLEVTFFVRELRRVIGGMNTEVGNQEGALVLGVTLPNLVGRGERAQMEYSYSTKRSNAFNATLSKPLQGKANGELLFSLYQQGTEVPWSWYKQLNRGTILDLAFQSAPQVQHNLQWEAVWRHISCLGRATPFAVREQCGPSLKSSLRHILKFDNRDSEVMPSEGTLFKLEKELAGLGGDVGFVKGDAELQVNVPLVHDLVFQSVIQGGFLSPLQNNKRYWICDKFFLGGPLNIRGFDLWGVGPHSEGGALGAEMYWATGVHIYSPLPLLGKKGRFSDFFRLQAFATAGNIGNFQFTQDHRENVMKLIEGFRISYGIGLLLRIGQVARVEINYTIPAKYQPGDRVSPGLQFGVGAAFL